MESTLAITLFAVTLGAVGLSITVSITVAMYLVRRMDALSNNFTTRMDDLTRNLTARIDGLNSRIDGLSARIDSLSTRIDGLSTRIENLSERLSAHERNIGERVTRVEGRLDVREAATAAA
ncbi:MAG: hypothetical protein OXG47_08615 [bacterium]|nr:hypothetical protein [bacterium]